MSEPTEITELLNAAISGDEAAQKTAYALAYEESIRCAQRQHTAVPGSSLTPTALVRKMLLRLNSHRVTKIQNREHFLSLAPRATRQIVVAHARRRTSLKHGVVVEVTDIDNARDIGERTAHEALDLDAALERLGDREPGLARVMEWQFFAGLTFKEIGEELGRHERIVNDHWEPARSVLQETMRDAGR